MFVSINEFVNKFKMHFELHELYQVALQTKFVKRTPKKIAPLDFIVSLFMCMFDESKTYENNAKKIATLIDGTVSRQAIEQRTTQETVEWLKQILLLSFIKTQVNG